MELNIIEGEKLGTLKKFYIKLLYRTFLVDEKLLEN